MPFKYSKQSGRPRYGIRARKRAYRGQYSTPMDSRMYLAKGRRVNTMIKQSIGGLPDFHRVKLKYQDNWVCTGGPDGYAIYKLNSLFDPLTSLNGNITTVTAQQSNAQPLYRDQWATMYDQYRVYACKVKLDMLTGGDSNASTLGGRVAVYASDTAISGETVAVSAARPGAIYKILNVGGGPKHIKMYVPIHKAVSTKKQTVATEDDFSALMGASPSRTAVLNINVDSTSGGGTTAVALYCDVTLTYYVELYNRIDVAGS